MSLKEKLLKQQNSERSQRIISYILLGFFAAFNVCFFMPMDIFLANAVDIAFPVKSLSLYMGLITIGVFTVIFLTCLFTKGKANAVFRSIVFGVSMAFYIQGNFLAINMGQLNGSEYEIPVWKAVLNIVIWLVILAAPFFILLKFPKIFDNVLSYIPAAIILIQILALGVSAYNNIPKYGITVLDELLTGDKRPMCTADSLDIYGKNKNLIIIVADEYDSFCFDSAIEEAPDTISEFDGFTYYTNTVGAYNMTHTSLAYITTGEKNVEYSNQTFYKNIAANFKTNIYTDVSIPPDTVTSKYADNIIYRKINLADTHEYSKTVYQLAFFRCMPEALKPVFWFGGGRIGKELDLTSGINLYDYDNLSFYENMPRALTTTDEDVFKFIYIMGLHDPRTVSKDLERVPYHTVSPVDGAIAINKIVNEYFKILKENGVYDNSEILFMADHGLSANDSKKYPLLMYKPAHQTETGIKVSNAPISHDDLYPTLIKLSGGEPQARTIFDIDEDEQRVRHFESTNEDVTQNIKQRSEQ